MSTALEGDLTGVVESASAGDEVAFARIIAAHDDDMARVAYLVCGNVQIAHDAVQAAWPIAWRKLRTLRDRTRLRAWLVTIAANEARRALRDRRRVAVREISLEAASSAGNRAAAWDQRDSHLDLMRALRSLSPEDRSIVAMRYALGLTSDEIASAVGRSPTGVRTRLARALARLRKELGDD